MFMNDVMFLLIFVDLCVVIGGFPRGFSLVTRKRIYCALHRAGGLLSMLGVRL